MGKPTMQRSQLNLGRINYLNCWPLFKQLPKELNQNQFNLISGHPTRLNSGLKSGEIDISPSSSMLLADADANDYFILPDITIASLSEVRSVILLSRCPLAELSGCTISLTNHSLTSISLLKIILFHFQKLKTNCLSFTNAEFSPGNELVDAALIIGDQALKFYHQPPAGYRVYDLGQLWYKFTNLPFVYALWIGRKDSIKYKGQAIIALHRSLNDITRTLPNKLADLSTTALTEIESNPEITPSQLLTYWRQAISYKLDKRALAGLAHFYKLAHDLKLIDQVPKLYFFPKP